MTNDPNLQRAFALELVRKLRAAGFLALWAGGCVRDQLLGRTPKDYDVATSATPEQIRQLFGRRKTIAVGAAFGVMNVVGPPGAGHIEVATFRCDSAYSDGRHPDEVVFSTPDADAARRDFTINGLFFDPIEGRVLDYVGGQEDIVRGVIRAIGDPYQRFAEDKLRLLRALRFTTAFGFVLEAKTLAAIREMAPQITRVSAERIADEVQKMLVHPRRSAAVGWLLETGLAAAILPEIVPADAPQQARLEETLQVLDRLADPRFPLALAALLCRSVDPAEAKRICLRWKLSNEQGDRVGWLVRHHASLRGAQEKRWSELQRLFIAKGIEDLVALNEGEARAGFGLAGEVAWCRAQLARPAEELNPPALITGDDLREHGVPPGPPYRLLLDRVRDAQLDGGIRTKEEALRLVAELRSSSLDPCPPR